MNNSKCLLRFALTLSGFIAVTSTGKWFDKFVLVVMENEDLSSVLNDPHFKAIASMGVLHTNYHGVTHPSQPNYWASIAGAHNFPGQVYVGGQNIPATTPFTLTTGDDSYDIYNAKTVVDLLDAARLGYKVYAENYPTPGKCYFGKQTGDETAVDAAHFKHHAVPLNPNGRAYVRKHNPFISFKSFTDIPHRCAAQQDFNVMNRDIASGSLPAYSFVVPNQAHDGHDTILSYSGMWLSQFVHNITTSPVNQHSRVLVHVVYDEGNPSGPNTGNTVYSVLLGSALPKKLVGTHDASYYTHYSILATLEANWGLGNLGKSDVGATVFKL